MTKTYLKLDFTLNSPEERLAFANNYLSKINCRPRDSDIEALANYILWARDPETGRNLIQEGYVLDPSPNSAYNRKEPLSLEALREANSSSIDSAVSLLGPIALGEKRVDFDRREAREKAPAYILGLLENLWRRIDFLQLDKEVCEKKGDLSLVRDSLLRRFTKEELEAALEKAKIQKTPHQTSARSQLIHSLHKEQFALRDLYRNPIGRRTTEPPSVAPPFTFDILPFGPFDKNLKIFLPFSSLNPQNFSTEDDLELVYRYLWKIPPSEDATFDLTDPHHIYYLFNNILTLESRGLRDLLIYYYKETYLPPQYKEILRLKLNGKTNGEIAKVLREEFGRTYSENYISTILTRKIYGKVAQTALYHREILENLFYPENFKPCKRCGTILLKDERNFVHKSRAKDGYANQCKRCDREERNMMKEPLYGTRKK